MRIAELRAPRFIAWQDWQKAKVKHAYSPWRIYRVVDHPEIAATQTWKAWESAEAWIQANQSAPITEDAVLTLHRLAMDGLMEGVAPGPGNYRTQADCGLALWRAQAPTREQIAALESLPYRDEDGTGRFHWRSTRCMDELSPALKKKIQPNQRTINALQVPAVLRTQFFKDMAGAWRQCGFYFYPPATAMRNLLRAWSKKVMLAREELRSGKGDPFLVAAQAQQELVWIHPFSQGNGRVSRLVMDWILLGAGLPPPVLQSMDDDLFLQLPQWRESIRSGIDRTIQILEECVKNPQAPSCAEVSLSP